MFKIGDVVRATHTHYHTTSVKRKYIGVVENVDEDKIYVRGIFYLQEYPPYRYIFETEISYWVSPSCFELVTKDNIHEFQLPEEAIEVAMKYLGSVRSKISKYYTFNELLKGVV